MIKQLIPYLVLAACSSPAATEPDAAPPDAGACATTVVAKPGTVITTSGPVTGYFDGATWTWKGIPYASPPTGDLRWKPPQPPACWTEERMTTAFGPACAQLDDNGIAIGSEDCLTLNVWAPPLASSADVLVFIHGGGNTQGTASNPLYDGSALAAQTNSIVVTLEYRLGALGFLAAPALDAESAQHVSGNYGIFDQIAALEWVKHDIAGFGGSPDHVLLFGESAGGQDTLVHVASPLSAGLFSAAIVESGGSYHTTLGENEAAMQAVTDAVGCTSAPDVAACLRAVPTDVLVKVPAAVGPLEKGLHYTPSIDNYLLGGDVPSLIAQGAYNKVPMVIGSNANETSRMVPKVTTPDEYTAAVQAMYGPTAAALLLPIYPITTTPQAALVRLTTDVTWTCPTRRLLRAAAAQQTAPVYRYYFSWTAPGAAGAAVGATHGLELPFVFRTFSALQASTPTETELAISDAMENYWSHLAATGDVNTLNTLAWPRYDATDPYMQFDTTIATGSGLQASQCDQIDALVSPP